MARVARGAFQRAAEHMDAAVLDVRTLRVFLLVDQVLVHRHVHQVADIVVVIRRAERGDVLRRVTVQIQVVPDEIANRLRIRLLLRHPVTGQLALRERLGVGVLKASAIGADVVNRSHRDPPQGRWGPGWPAGSGGPCRRARPRARRVAWRMPWLRMCAVSSSASWRPARRNPGWRPDRRWCSRQLIADPFAQGGVREPPARQALGVGGNDDAAPVGRVGRAGDVPGFLEAVEHLGHSAGGQAKPGGQIAGHRGPGGQQSRHWTSASGMPSCWAIAMDSRTAAAACRAASVLTSASSSRRLGGLATLTPPAAANAAS